MKYFYIICRDGQMFEVPFSEQNYKGATQELLQKGLMAIKPVGAEIPVIINSVDVSKILDEQNYEDYIFSSKPQLYIMDGVWRDGKERKVVRYEKWKQKEIDGRQKLESGQDHELTPEEKELSTKKLEEIKRTLNLSSSR